jgi:hypothetical protein
LQDSFNCISFAPIVNACARGYLLASCASKVQAGDRAEGGRGGREKGKKKKEREGEGRMTQRGNLGT